MGDLLDGRMDVLPAETLRQEHSARMPAGTMVLLAATALILYVCYRLLVPFLSSLAWGLALAVIADGLHRWLARRIRSANVAAALSVTIVVVVLIVPSVFVVERLTRQVMVGVESVDWEAGGARLHDMLHQWPRLAPALDWLQQHVDLRGELYRLAQTLPALASRSVGAVGEFLLSLFFLFFFLRDRDRMLAGARDLLPLSREEADAVGLRVTDTLRATVYGTLILALVQGTLGGLMFWWLGLPAPALWGVVMSLFAVVPFLGAFLVWAPAALYLAFAGLWVKATILALWGLLVVSLADNLLYPVLVGKRMRLHPLPVVLAFLGGIALFGASGVVLGPVTLALTIGLLEIWKARGAHAAHQRLEYMAEAVERDAPACTQPALR